MPGLKRPLTLCLQLPPVGRITEEDVLESLLPHIDAEKIKCIQVTSNEGWVTVADDTARNQLIGIEITIKGRSVRIQNNGLNVTNVTIKDAPFELPNDDLITTLSAYGNVVRRSMRMGTIKGTQVKTGTRYVEIIDVDGPIPTELKAGEYNIRVFCDNGKTECRHCGQTSHPSYKCPIKPGSNRRCYRCFSTGHVIKDCSNEIVCRHCCQTGHREAQCVGKEELTKFGDYRHEIAEGRLATDLEKDTTDLEPTPTTLSNEHEKSLKHDTKSEGDKDNSDTSNIGENNISVRVTRDATPSTSRNMKGTPANSAGPSTPQTIDEFDIQCQTIIIGDSLLHNIEKPGVMITNRSGASIADVDELITSAMNRSRKELKPDHVVIHLGTNDITYKKTSAPLVIVKYSVALDSLEKTFQGAKIGICSIPPRKGSSTDVKRSNTAATIVNEYLESLAQVHPDRYVYIDTWSKLWSTKGHAMKHHYDKSDEKGVHMTESGRELLISSIINTLYPEPANINKRKNSATHSPANDKQLKEQRLSSTPPMPAEPSESDPNSSITKK